MKAIVLDQKHSDKISLREMDLPRLGPLEVRVKIHAAALNHRDEWCRIGRYPNIENGVVLGSDGAGTVVETGSEVDAFWMGKEVVINPAMNWGENQKAQSDEFKILGMPDHGTLAEFVHVPADRIHEKPSHLTMEEAAALPLGGLTAYRAAFYHGQISPGEVVLVTGFGGGVAQFAAQYASAAGAEVYVSSSKSKKILKAVELGAKGGFNYKDRAWTADAIKETGGFDLIIDSAAGDTFEDLVKILKPGGKLVFYGATLGNIPAVNARKLFWNQLTVQGSTMGSDQDFLDMLAFVNQHQIVPLVDSVRPLKRAKEAFEMMASGEQLGKLVIKVAD